MSWWWGGNVTHRYTGVASWLMSFIFSSVTISGFWPVFHAIVKQCLVGLHSTSCWCWPRWYSRYWGVWGRLPGFGFPLTEYERIAITVDGTSFNVLWLVLCPTVRGSHIAWIVAFNWSNLLMHWTTCCSMKNVVYWSFQGYLFKDSWKDIGTIICFHDLQIAIGK